jgi:NhaA family Na+:H+ antiporter
MVRQNITRIVQHEACGGVILFLMAVTALILSNSPWASPFAHFWQIPIAVNVSQYSLDQPLLFWVNEGLMTLFFLLIGLELKRELLQGMLRTRAQILLPAIGALGGMVVPALIFCLFNAHDAETLRGWAIPVATDIAFALGVLSLFGKRVPKALKLFLLALAIFDDVGAIVIIAIFHSGALSYIALSLAVLCVASLCLLNWLGVRRLSVYLLVGLALWFCVLHSGVHATVAGVLIAMSIPLTPQDANTQNSRGISPAARLEHSLQPWVGFFIMPLFALANAGISLAGISSDILTSPLVTGTVAGLFIGKQLGVLGFSWVIIKLKWAKLPAETSWRQLYGTAILCGIGFTMSLFLGTLTFEEVSPTRMIEVRLGVLLGSMLSGIVGAMLLQSTFQKPATS